MSYYERFNSDGRLKPLEQVKNEREVSRSQSQSNSVMSSLLNMFKSLFK